MRSIACAAVVLALVACSRQPDGPESTEVALPPGAAAPAVAPASAAITGFSHPAGYDLYGYYMPTTEVQVGDFLLSHFHMGGIEDFTAFEGGDRSGSYAPVMFQFDDVTSPMVTNELGGEHHSVTERATADAYAITPDGAVTFVDNHPKLGRVEFHGRLDMIALKAAQSENPPAGPPSTVLTGRLAIGERVFDNLAFTWFGGD